MVERKETEKWSLLYVVVGLALAIVSATVMMRRKKEDSTFDDFDIALLGCALGSIWPITLVVGIVYAASKTISELFKKNETKENQK